MAHEKEGDTQLSIIITLVIALLFVGFIKWKKDPPKRKRCNFWIYATLIRGRVQYDVLCGRDSLINDQGEIVPLTWYLREQKEEINKQYNILQHHIKSLQTSR